MKILFIVAEHDEKNPSYFKAGGNQGGVFVIDEGVQPEKELYGKILFEIEKAIGKLKDLRYEALKGAKKKTKPSKTKKK